LEQKLKYWIALLTASLLSTGVAMSEPREKICQNQVSARETQETFHRLAPTLPYFDLTTVLYNRFQSYGKSMYSGFPDSGKVYAEIESGAHSKESLISLLRDSDAKVRTLALAALYAKEEAKLLPEIVNLVDDQAKTYSEPVPVASAMPPNAPPPLEEKTVGRIAESIARFYLEAAGYYYGTRGSGKEPGFTQYWQVRQNRTYCASWFAVKLKRASTGRSPTDKARAVKIAAIRAQIDKIQGQDRHWTLLWMQTENGSDLLATEKDINAAMEQLGPDKLMQMLQRKIPSRDPDLQPRRGNDFPYKTMMLCVLKHAKTCLRRNQVPLLLGCDQWERAYQEHHMIDPLITPWFTIAAAQLEPTQSDYLLHREFSRLDEDFYGFKKAELAEALWQSGGVKEIPFLLNSFYDSKSLWQGKQYSQFRPQWLKNIKGKSSDCQRLLKSLINDSRFDKLDDCSALRALMVVNSKYAGHATTDLEHTGNAWHPLGVDSCCCDVEKARKDYPKETKELLDLMAKWRQQLKASVN